MKLVGGLESGPLMPKTASWTLRPGFTSRAITRRLEAFQPFTTDPPLCPMRRGSSPSTQISA